MTPLWPLALVWLAGAALCAADGRRRAVGWIASGVLAVALGLDLALLGAQAGGAEPFETVTGGWEAGVGIRLRGDLLALLFGTLVSAVLLVVLVHETRAGNESRLFPALVLLLAAGLHGAFLTGDLFDFYVFFELSIVASFVLAAHGNGKAELRGTLVYVAVNLLGSVLFLFGVATLYQARGTLDLRALAGTLGAEDAAVGTVAGALIFASLALKLGLFPFHGWVPVLYGHARPAVAAAMSGALVNLGAYGLLRIGWTALDGARATGAPLLVVLGAGGAVYGGLLALGRARPVEVTAYAAVAHAGYVVLAVGCGGVAGIAAAVAVVVAGSLDKAAMFLALDAPPRAREASVLAAAAGTGGLPPTAGFAAKVLLLAAAFQGPLPGLAVSAVLVSSLLVLAAAVRFRRRVARAAPRPRTGGLAPLALVATSVVIGVWPAPLADLARRIAGTLAEGGG